MGQPCSSRSDCSCTHRADDTTCRVEQVDDCVVVTVGGPVDTAVLPALLDALNVAAFFAPRIVIDLTRVTSLDPAALDNLTPALGSAGDSKEWLSVIGPAGVVHAALQGCESGRDFSVHDHVDDAEVAFEHAAEAGGWHRHTDVPRTPRSAG